MTREQLKQEMKKVNKRLCRNGTDLKKAMNDFAQLYIEDLTIVLTKVLLDAFKRVVATTPVDTGRARASWHIGAERKIDVLPAGEYEEYKNNVDAVVSAYTSSKELSLQDADVIYIMNNMEYILYLEAGWSKQNAGFIGTMLLYIKQELIKLTKVRAV